MYPVYSCEREEGEGYRVSIRGLGPRFVRTTINGRTALSSSGGETGGGDDARSFTFNIMPSEVVSKAQVTKTTQAWELEGGIGGTVDLITNRPLDFKRKGDDIYFSASARGHLQRSARRHASSAARCFSTRSLATVSVSFSRATIDEADRIDNLAESQRFKVFPGEDSGGRYEEGTLVNGVPLGRKDGTGA